MVYSFSLTLPTPHSLNDLRRYHNDATKFFATELMLLKESIAKIVDERLAKAAVLLISCGQTHWPSSVDKSNGYLYGRVGNAFARSFMEKMTNFCYVGVCDETEYRAFILHPVYKYYHLIGSPTIEDDLNLIAKNKAARAEKQGKLKSLPIVQEALTIFSETKDNMTWTKKTLRQRIAVIEEMG